MRQHVSPVIAPASDGQPTTLEQISPAALDEGGEGWLQDLVQANPGVLPIREIEPAFAHPTTVCTELPLDAGPLDIFMMNAAALPTLVETKLWHNPDARRRVIAQALDYARSLADTDMETLEHAIVQREPSAASIYDLLAERLEDLPERPRFYDALADHLAKGRFLILLAGDGVRREVEALTDFLRAHASLDFTFGLVELPAYRLPTSHDVLVTPRVVAKTIDIERAATPTASGASSTQANHVRRTTVSEKRFLELLEENEPGLAEHLQEFLDRVKDLGVEVVPGTSRQGSIQLYYKADEGKTLNFGTLRASGHWSHAFHFFLGEQAHERYKQKVARLIGGAVQPTQKIRVVKTADGGDPRLRDLLNASDAWLDIIKYFIGEADRDVTEETE